MGEFVHKYPGYDEEAAAAIGSAGRNRIRLEEAKKDDGDQEWARKLGFMAGAHLPKTFVSPHYSGEEARVTIEQITPALYELLDRPDLLPVFYQEFIRWLQTIQVIKPPRSPSHGPNSLTRIQTMYRDGEDGPIM